MGRVSTKTVGTARIYSDPKIQTFLVEQMVTLRELAQFFVYNKVNKTDVASRKTNITERPTISNSLDASVRLLKLIFIKASLIKVDAVFIKNLDVTCPLE